jgi:hypothetical protein
MVLCTDALANGPGFDRVPSGEERCIPPYRRIFGLYEEKTPGAGDRHDHLSTGLLYGR